MTNIKRYHVIKDPVHGTMQFSTIEDQWVKPFIDSEHFQRLRHIKQLGMGDYIFPGAVHTRFNHCLGCCYVGSQIAAKIGLADEERQLVMIACLLHDIGHGPFSHTFEDIFYQKRIRHEDWTPFFLADYRTADFFESYNQKNPRYHLNSAKFDQIEGMIMHQPSAKRVLADIVSSQMDADRLDYLLRDSHFCGVSYGQFDFRWLLHCMTIVDTALGERLGINYKGIGVVEHYLMARRLMMRNIYHSHKKLGLEFLLVQLLINFSEQLSEPIYKDIPQTNLIQFLKEVNAFNEEAVHTTNIPSLKKNFLKAYYPLYKSLCDYDVFSLIKSLVEINNKSPACSIAARIHLRDMPKIIQLDFFNVSSIDQMISEFKMKNQNHFQYWQIGLIKTPHQSYVADGDPILVVNEYHRVRPIHEMSFMIQAFSDKSEETAFLCIDRAILDHPKVVALIHDLSDQYSHEADAGCGKIV